MSYSVSTGTRHVQHLFNISYTLAVLGSIINIKLRAQLGSGYFSLSILSPPFCLREPKFDVIFTAHSMNMQVVQDTKIIKGSR